jgi:death-on-curing protein
VKEPLWLSKALILAVHDRLLADYGGSPGVRDEGLLESALSKPQNLFAYGQPSIFQLAASYAFGIVKNHPFIDGNKRTGFVAAGAFLDSNGFELTASEVDATLKTFGLAAGEVSESEYATWLEKSCEKIRRG